MSPTDDTSGSPRPRSGRTTRVDPSHLTDLAGAFSDALQVLHQARSQFAAGAHGLAQDLGDAPLGSRYDGVYQQMLGVLDAIEHCFEELFRALSSAGTAYEETDTSVAGPMR